MIRFETISTGDEILRGRSLDTNGPWLAAAAASDGVLRRRHTVVGDDPEALAAAISSAAAGLAVVVVTGGLGPTEDDYTRAAAARAAGVALVEVPALRAVIEERYRVRGQPVRETARRQAYVPEGATPLHNPLGTAPGFLVTIGGGRVFCLSGVPSEMRAMYDAHVRPVLQAERGIGGEGAFRCVATFGQPEAEGGE